MCKQQNVHGLSDLIIKNPSERSERGRTKLLTGHKNLNISKTKADIEKFPEVKKVLFLIFHRET